jgi:hypothetical protein
MGMTYSTHCGKRNACSILIRKPEGKIARKNWTYMDGDDIKMNLREMRWSCMDWTDLAEDRDHWGGFL